jgi:hypothetical protein
VGRWRSLWALLTVTDRPRPSQSTEECSPPLPWPRGPLWASPTTPHSRRPTTRSSTECGCT